MRTSNLVLGLAATLVCALQETEAQTLVTRVYYGNDIGSYAFDPPFWTYHSKKSRHFKSAHWFYGNHRYVFIDIRMNFTDLRMVDFTDPNENSADGHVSKQTAGEMDIVVLASGSTPEDPSEFHFLNEPTTFWTLARNVTNSTSPAPTSALVPTSSATKEPTPLPAESPTLTPGHIQRRHERNAPFDDDNGQRIWHQVDGKWKWYLASKHHVLVKRALPVDAAPVVKP